MYNGRGSAARGALVCHGGRGGMAGGGGVQHGGGIGGHAFGGGRGCIGGGFYGGSFARGGKAGERSISGGALYFALNPARYIHAIQRGGGGKAAKVGKRYF